MKTLDYAGVTYLTAPPEGFGPMPAGPS